MWRYSRIEELDLEAYAPLGTGEAGRAEAEVALPPRLQAVVDAVPERAGLLVLRDGRVVHSRLDPAVAGRGVTMGPVQDQSGSDELLGSLAGAADVFVDLNTAFMVDAAVVRVPPGVAVEQPILVLHWLEDEGAAVFPRLVVRTETASQVSVLDYVASPDGAAIFSAPVVELDAGEASNLSYLGVQELGRSAWQVGHQASRADRDATLVSSLVALGGDYARVSTDSRLEGQGGTSRLRAVYFGDGHQMHDFRTLQDHDAPKTTSDLLFKGAVQD